jgi:hypothetical protein
MMLYMSLDTGMCVGFTRQLHKLWYWSVTHIMSLVSYTMRGTVIVQVYWWSLWFSSTAVQLICVGNCHIRKLWIRVSWSIVIWMSSSCMRWTEGCRGWFNIPRKIREMGITCSLDRRWAQCAETLSQPYGRVPVNRLNSRHQVNGELNLPIQRQFRDFR